MDDCAALSLPDDECPAPCQYISEPSGHPTNGVRVRQVPAPELCADHSSAPTDTPQRAGATGVYIPPCLHHYP